MNKVELAEKIRTLRKSLKLRQEDLAAKSGVSIGVIKDIEAGKGNPTLESLDSIVSVLGVSLFQILMPGMISADQGIVNAPRAVGRKDSDKKDNASDISTPIGAISKPGSQTEWNENKGSEAGQPPHEMSKEIAKVIHGPSSDTNIDDFRELVRILPTLDKNEVNFLLRQALTFKTVKVPNPQTLQKDSKLKDEG